MRISGLRISLFILFYFVSHIIQGQSECPCLEDACGDIIASFKLDGDQTVVCDGSEFSVINNSVIPDVSYYIWDWGDGTRDSVTTTAKQKHTYNIPIDKVCQKEKTTFTICLLAVKKCGTTYSCHSNQSPIAIVHRPIAKFEYQNTVCKGKPVAFTDKSCNVKSSLADAYTWIFHDGTTSSQKNPSRIYSAPGTYNITLTVKNDCGSHSEIKSINVIDYPDARVNISLSARDSMVCVGDTITLIDTSNVWAFTNWTFPGNSNFFSNVLNDTLNWKLDKKIRNREKVFPIDTIIYLDTIQFVVLKKGTYKFILTSRNVCDTLRWVWNLKVFERPSVTLDIPPPGCETAALKPKVNINGEYTGILWSFPGGMPESSDKLDPGTINYNSPGNYPVSVTIYSLCDTIMATQNLVVNTRDPVQIQDVNQPICSGSSPLTLLADRLGGIWSGPGITNAAGGTFNPTTAGPGDHTITYTIGPAGCQASDQIVIRVIQPENVTIQDRNFCQDDAPAQIVASPASGTWSGPGISSGGVFDPSATGVGVYNVMYIYTDVNNCQVIKNVAVRVETLPLIEIKDTLIVCEGGGTIDLKELFEFKITPSGGTTEIRINGSIITGLFNLDNQSVSQFDVEFLHISGSCQVSKKGILRTVPKENIEITKDTTLCVSSEFFQLETSRTGGSWSGPGVDPDTGIITLSQAGSGSKKYIYSYLPNSTCEQIKTVEITITDPAGGLVAGQDESICTGPTTYAFSGFSPSGGRWAGIGIDPVTGITDLSQLKPDTTYTYTYCIEDSQIQNCNACRQKKFTVTSLPQPTYEVKGLFCIDEEVNILHTTPGNVNFQFFMGDGTSYAVPNFTHKYSSKGNYTIRLEVTDPNGCKNNIEQNVYVTTKPISSFLIPDAEGCAPFLVELENKSSGDDISFLWNIHDQQLTVKDPPGIYLDHITKDSTFIITLATSNACGTVEYIDSVRVLAYPLPAFGASVLSGCAPLTVQFNNISQGNPQTYYWDFGNGIMLMEEKPEDMMYTTTGDTVTRYQVVLAVGNICGVDTIKKEITVYPADVSAFIEAPVLSVCQYDTFSATAYSTPGAINTWKVIEPDGLVVGVSGTALQLKAEKSGIYTAILYASRCGTDTDTVKIEVLPAATIGIKLPDYVCQDQEVTFSYDGNQIGGVLWDFGDGIKSDLSNPIHTYKEAGEYIITLTGWSLVHNCPYTVSSKLKVIGKPKATFTASTLAGCTPLQVSFNNQSAGAVTHVWTFGDNTNSQLKNPDHTYLQAGTYKVTLRVYDEFQCFEDTSLLNITAYPLPEAAFTFENIRFCYPYDTLKITNQSTGASNQFWQVGNESAQTKNAEFNPPNPGIFDIKLVAISDFGCRDSATSSITILESPESIFTVNTMKGCTPLQLSFTNTSKESSVYLWDFDNGTTTTEIEPVYIFSKAGTYTVRLVAISQNGCPSDTSAVGVEAYPVPQSAFESKKDSLCGIPMRVQFIDRSSADLAASRWVLDGNIISNDKDFSYVFVKDGIYKLSLEVANIYGCKDSSTQEIAVYEKPKAAFEIAPEACEDESIIIANLSTSARTYEWIINGSLKSEDEVPEIGFSSAGEYRIRLIAAYNAFCKDTFDVPYAIKVYQRPKADFSYEAGFDESKIGEVRFTNLSSDYTNVYWQFGDGLTSSERDPIHEYNINREILVTLTAFQDNGGLKICADSITKIIEPEWINTFYAPNAFAPEFGEGLTRVFKPVGLGIKTYAISVYSPWGEKVWFSNELKENAPSASWDGHYKGAIVPQGAFTWVAEVEFQSGIRKIFRGSVTVIR